MHLRTYLYHRAHHTNVLLLCLLPCHLMQIGLAFTFQGHKSMASVGSQHVECLSLAISLTIGYADTKLHLFPKG